MSLIILSPHIYKSSKIFHGNSHSSDKQKLSERKYVHDCIYPLFTKITIMPILPLNRNFSELSEVVLPGLQSSFCPKYNLTCNSDVVHFFKLTQVKVIKRFRLHIMK